jgi:CubicO group peptidase (beta-lactamase class C family)
MDVHSVIEASREKVRAIMDRNGVPGASVVLIADGRPVWMEGFGATDVGGKRVIDPHTIFSLQSTSKTFAATAVMIAVQRGLLDLDRPITAYLPDFTVFSRHERDPQAKMTLRLLLSHRAGFTHEAPVGGNFEPDFPTAPPDFEAHVASISRTWLRYPVGQRYAYSNLGIDLAGYILMRACAASSYGECLKTLIFDPLGMADTTAAQDVYAAEANRAIGHQPGFDVVPVRIPLDASGGVYSSAVDMARYAAFHLGRGTFEGRPILDRALWETMHTPTFDGFPYALGIVKQTRELEKGRVDTFTHNGGGFGFGSSFIYGPDQGLAWVLLYNGQTIAGPPAPFDDVAIDPVLEAMFGQPVAARPPTATVIQPTPEALAALTGTYLTGQISLTMTQDAGGLEFRVTGEAAPNRLAFTGPDTAFVMAGPRTPQSVRFHPPYGELAAWMAFSSEGALQFSGASGFDFNDSDRDLPGVVGDRYDRFLGPYEVRQWGKTLMQVSLTKKNGYPYLGSMRTREHLDGLFFTGDGEALDLRGERPTFRNIRLIRARP